MTASSRINSHTDQKRIDDTRGIITLEEGDFLVNESNIDRQTHAHLNKDGGCTQQGRSSPRTRLATVVTLFFDN